MPQVIPFVTGFLSGLGVSGGAVSVGVGASQIGAASLGVAIGSNAVVGFVVKAGALVAVSAAASNIAMKGMGGEGSPSSLSNAMDPMPSSRTIYGQTKTGGVIVFAKATTGYTSPNDTTKKNQILHMVIELAGHPCQSVDAIYLGNTNLNYTELTDVDNGEVLPNDDPTDDNGVTRYQPSGTPYDKHMAMKIYTGGQTQADADLVEATTIQDDADKWTTDHIGREKTYVYFRMHFKSELFRGIPQFTFDVKGKKNVQFLGGSVGYSSNPIHCLYDYMTLSKERGGFGVSSSEIDGTSWGDAAGRCNDNVSVYDDSTTQKRYFCGGIISAGQEPHAIIKSLLDACAGVIEWVGGKWYVWAYRPDDINPSTQTFQTLTESELVDFPVWQLNQSAKDAVNSIKPVIRSSETAWQPSEVQSVEALRKIFGQALSDTFSSPNHGLENGDRVKLAWWTGTTIENSNLIARGLQPEFYYYVVQSTSNTFKIATSKGGGSISFGSSTTSITVLHDIYLSLDGERNSSEMVFTMVNDATMARRLAIINLRQARQEVSGTLICKPGTAYACPADLFVGDTIRILNNELSFYEITTSLSASVSSATNRITATNHQLEIGDAVTFTDISSSTGLSQNKIYYAKTVSNISNYFTVSEYRDGPEIDIKANDSALTVNKVEGKLFRVVSYRPILNDGLFTIELGVRATATNIYDWTDDREIEPETTPGITVQSLYDVGDVTNFTADSGTDQLYIQKDGTLITRVKLSWDETDDEYVAASGQVDIEYKLNSETEWIKYPKVIGSATEAYLTDVIDGETYDFRVRFRNAFGKEGEWNQLDPSHTVIGKEGAPNPPSTFSATYVNGADRIDLQWTNPPDLDLSHTVIGRSVSVYQKAWRNWPSTSLDYDEFDGSGYYPDGFYAEKTQTSHAAYAISPLKLFSFPAGATIRVQFVFNRISGSVGSNPRVYGYNASGVRCTDHGTINAPTTNVNYNQFIDLTVDDDAGNPPEDGPCVGFAFENAASDVLDYVVTYFNARTYPDYETIAEIPVGTTRGKDGTDAVQKWSEALVLKSDSARTHYYQIYSVDTSGNISETKPRESVRINEWESVSNFSVSTSQNNANFTWTDTGRGDSVLINILAGGVLIDSVRQIESVGSTSILNFSNGTYTAVAYLIHNYLGTEVYSRPVYFNFTISGQIPLSEPDYYYIRPNDP